jgi:NTE family protein
MSCPKGEQEASRQGFQVLAVPARGMHWPGMGVVRPDGDVRPDRSGPRGAGLPKPTTYAEWKAWAQEEDRRSGADLWRLEEQSDLYDYRVIRRRYDELCEVRASGDPVRLVYYFNEGIHGNMGGMGNPALHMRAHFGTKELVTRYVAEIVAALEDLAAADEAVLTLKEKAALFRRSSHCFGRSALMLSGAGTLGAFHLGVVKVLNEHDILPRVVSGASAGAVVAAVVGTHAADQLPSLLTHEGIADHFEALSAPPYSGRRRLRLRVEHLHELVESAIPDMTFGEALEETGRDINIAVAPASLHQRARLLNASTAHNAFIREAVLASCAIPGVFPPVTLAARDASGRRKPYVPSRQWVDGSITDDQPARRLARLYGVNHFITSQANPIALWVERDPHASSGLLGRLTGVASSASREGLRTVYPFAMEAVRNLYPLNTWLRLWFSVITQDYTADVNIRLSKRIVDPSIVLALLSREESEALIREGERATWPRVEMIRTCTAVSRCIDRLREEIEQRLSDGAEAAPPMRPAAERERALSVVEAGDDAESEVGTGREADREPEAERA